MLPLLNFVFAVIISVGRKRVRHYGSDMLISIGSMGTIVIPIDSSMETKSGLVAAI